MNAKSELEAMGLKPLPWNAVLQAVRAKLDDSGWEKFSRLHRGFVEYRGEDSLRRFYGFVFDKGLQKELNCFRFGRLEAILTGAASRIRPGLSVLDVGAGAGFAANVLAPLCQPGSYVVHDLCDEVRAHLGRQGFIVLPHPAPPQPAQPFDLILCADSLGEINADEDGWLTDPAHAGHPDFEGILESRYGFAQKLEPWKLYLAPEGSLLLWEPITKPHVWKVLGDLLREHGWRTEMKEEVRGEKYMELKRRSGE